MNQAHLVMLSRSLPFHRIGGMEAVAWDLARQFAAGGVRVTMLTTRIPGQPQCFTAEGVELVALPHAPPGRYSWAWWRDSRAYFERHLLGSAAAVLSVSVAAYGLLPLRPRMAGVPMVLQLHGTFWGEATSKWRSLRPRVVLASCRNLVRALRDLRCLPQFDRVVAVGDAVMHGLHSPPISWVLPPGRVLQINNGVDTRLFCPQQASRTRMRAELGIAGRGPLVLSASRLHREKGLDLSLRAFARFAAAHEDARFVVVGEGTERARLEALARALGLAGKVTFAGGVERSRMPELLRAADVFLFTTTRLEGLPLNFLEALAVGVPVVISRHVTERYAFGQAVQGVEPRDAEAVAAALGRALQQPAGVASLLPESFTLAHCVGRYRRLLGLPEPPEAQPAGAAPAESGLAGAESPEADPAARGRAGAES